MASSFRASPNYGKFPPTLQLPSSSRLSKKISSRNLLLRMSQISSSLCETPCGFQTTTSSYPFVENGKNKTGLDKSCPQSVPSFLILQMEYVCLSLPSGRKKKPKTQLVVVRTQQAWWWIVPSPSRQIAVAVRKNIKDLYPSSALCLQQV